MKIGSPAQPAFLRDMAKPAKPATAVAKETPAESPKTAPPGLAKVQARLEGLGAERSTGQSNALDRISRNLSRYTSIQGDAPVVTPPATPAAAETPAPAPAPADVAAAPATDTASASDPTPTSA